MSIAVAPVVVLVTEAIGEGDRPLGKRKASYHRQTSATRVAPRKRLSERRESSIFLFLFLAEGSSRQTIDRTLCLHLGHSSWNQNLLLRFEENFKLCLWIAKK